MYYRLSSSYMFDRSFVFERIFMDRFSKLWNLESMDNDR